MDQTSQLKAALQVSLIICDAVRDAGPMGIPSGHLYAALMSKVGLDAYNSILAVVVRKGWIRNSGHLLTWTGPTNSAGPAGTVGALVAFNHATAPAATAAPFTPDLTPAPAIVVNKLPRRRSRKAVR